MSDEQNSYLTSFINDGNLLLINSYSEEYIFLLHIFFLGIPQQIIISQNNAGQLFVHVKWPDTLKNKGVFFVKRKPEPLPADENENLNDFVAYGDIHPNVLGKYRELIRN